MKKMRIFHISGNRYSPLSTDHHTFRIWVELAKGFDEYHVVARNTSNRYAHSVHGKIHLHLLPSFGTKMGVFFFLSWILPFFVWRYKPTHLLVQSPVMGGLSAAFCSRIFRIPLFVEVHGAYYFEVSRPGIKGRVENFLYRMLSPFAFRQCVKIRSLSNDMTDKIKKVYGYHLENKIVTIPVRVDTSIFDIKKESYKLQSSLKIMMVGALSERKNQVQLVNDLRLAGLNIDLTLAGDGPLRNSLESMANDLSSNVKIILTGQLNHKQLRKVLSGQDCYIHYSLSEGTPRAVLEAMALNIPVITVDYPYMRGILEDGKNALIMSRPEPDQLARALSTLIESEELRKNLGENGRKLIETRFESKKVFELYRDSILGISPLGEKLS